MAKTEEINLKINADVKGANKNVKSTGSAAKSAATSMALLGLSIGAVKTAFATAKVQAKAMFGSIKAGLITSGIGAFAVIIGSIISYFKKTKRGAEQLERAMAGLGAVMSILVDAFSRFGEKAVEVFTNPKQAAIDLWDAIKTNLVNRVEGLIDSFGYLGDAIKSAMSLDWDGLKENAAGFGESIVQTATGVDDLVGKMADGFGNLANEIDKNVESATALKQKTQDLREAENLFNIERAKTNKEIQKARLEALDESKTAEERLAALQLANDLELETTKKAIKLQKEKVEIQEQEMLLSENMQEDEDKLAALKVDLINLETKSFQTQKRLATEMETLTNEIAANKKAKEKEEADEKAAKDKRDQDAANVLRKLQLENTVLALEDTSEKARQEIEIQRTKELDSLRHHENFLELKEEIDKKYDAKQEDRKKKEAQLTEVTEAMKLKAMSNGLKAMSSLAGEHKGLAVAQATIDMYGSIVGALNDKTVPSSALRFANAVSMGVMGAANIKKILSTDVGSGSGGGSAPSIDSGTPSQQFSSGSFELSGGTTQEPVRAFVVTDDMSSSQDKLKSIRRRATI